MTTPLTDQEPTPLTDEELAGIERYWEQPTGHYAASPGMVEAARFNIGQMRATIDSLRSDLAALSVRVEEAEGERDEALAGERLASRVVARHLPDAVESAERDAALLAAEERVRQLSEVVEAADGFIDAYDGLDSGENVAAAKLRAALARLQVDSEPTTEPAATEWVDVGTHDDPYFVEIPRPTPTPVEGEGK